MASACVNNLPVLSFSPRVSFSLDPPTPDAGDSDHHHLDSQNFIDFEFHLNDPVAMLTADQLFSDGKLVPLHLNNNKQTPPPPPPTSDGQPPLKPVVRTSSDLAASDDNNYNNSTFAVSPKAPTCSSRWRELLRRKRQQQLQQTSATKQQQQQQQSKSSSSLKQFLNRNLRSSSDLSLPLLKESSDSDPSLLSVSSRLSLSSTSSSGHESEDIVARLSLDNDHKPNRDPILLNRNPPRVRVSRAAGTLRAGRSPARRTSEPPPAAAPPPRCASVDSPRMNASGKVVFQGLGRSSSSPSTFNGGPRVKHRGMERSYSANVRVTPVLNVPVCSLRGGSKSFGFGQLFSGSSSSAGTKPACNKPKN